MYCMYQQDVKQAKKEGKTPPEPPALFNDAGYATLNHTTISTSNCGNPALRLFGFGPVVPDGFGIGYIIKDDGISICASSKHLQTKRYLDTLRAYFLDAKQLILQLYKEANQRPDLHFVDHHGGLVDARTGRPIATKSSNERSHSPTEQTEGEEHRFGYDFFGEQDTLSRVLGSGSRQRKRNVGAALSVADW